MSDILSGVASVGFPVVMAILELYYIITRLDKMTEIINNNTIALQKLTTFLHSEEVDNDK